jgi:hypothetical protein
VNAELDTETLTGLVAQVVTEAEGVDVVAEEWLASLDGGATTGTGVETTVEATDAADTTEPATTSEAPATTG